MSFNPESSTSMRFNAFWKPIIRVFQLLCISHYSVFQPDLKTNRLKKWALLLYYLFFDAMDICTLAYISIDRMNLELFPQSFNKEIPLMYYVHSIGVFGSFITHITTHIETLFKGKSEIEILEKFKEINLIFSAKLKHEVQFNVLRRKLFYESAFVFTLSAIMISAGVVITVVDYGNNFRCTSIYGIIIVCGRGCQISFMINSLCDCLRNLEIQIKRKHRNIAIKRSGCSIENIQYFREIYSKIWLIKNLISECYGWSMISFLIQFTMTIINLSYSIYMNLHFVNLLNLNIRELELRYFHFYIRCVA